MQSELLRKAKPMFGSRPKTCWAKYRSEQHSF